MATGPPRPERVSPEWRARALADLMTEISPRLLADLRASGALSGAGTDAVQLEWDAVALHACIRGVAAAGARDDDTANLVDAFHDLLLPRLATARELASLRAHLARRYAEYDGITRTLGRDGAARVPSAIAAAFAKHVGVEGAALADAVAPLLEAIAEGASSAVADAGAALALPPLEPLRRIAARLDAARIAWGVGGSALLASLGLVTEVNDWDVQVEAEPERVQSLFQDVPHTFHGHGGCHADWKLAFAAARTELIPRFAFFVPGGVVRVRLAVSRPWRGLAIASPEGWACAYWLMGEYDEPHLRARRAARAEALLAHLERAGADRARTEAMLAEPLPEPLAARLRALRPLA